ncbi:MULTISPECIES: NUDIX hydrolase [Bacillaceae]|uniref:NUDIX hydrolase n=1 Tax=Bacillaceae TaxID=186817 RepID=UPI0029647836|nr:NUDIX hydrolase [Bacillus infantis]MDW2879527.1 NUDIX hydrolase [Bacillus infantis]
MIRNAVGAIVFQGEEYLLVHKVKRSALKASEGQTKGEWDFPKGGVEESDKGLKDAILRELAEESGSAEYRIIKQLQEKICFDFDREFAKKTGWIRQETVMFVVEYVGNRSDLKAEDSEINGVEFVESDEVLERLGHGESKEFFWNWSQGDRSLGSF